MRCTYVDGGYLDQPEWFVELYKMKIEVEAEYDKTSKKS
jgi:hypothetical protein